MAQQEPSDVLDKLCENTPAALGYLLYRVQQQQKDMETLKNIMVNLLESIVGLTGKIVEAGKNEGSNADR